MRELPPRQQAPAFRTRPARKGAPPLSRSLGPHLARLAKASGAMDPRLAAEWAELAGPDLAPLCRPVRVVQQGRVQALEVSVPSGAAGTKLRYHQEALLGRIRHKIGYPRLTKLIIREGAGQRSWEKRRMSKAPDPSPPAPAKSGGPKDSGLKAALEAMRRTIHEKPDA
jgi:hypothetical protein